ncbi:MAG: terpene cyclase/mutase family protein [Planctomycetes bacterium]|nr:terpene cyclase/mutase family protein [Planctomycetota bacterium]
MPHANPATILSPREAGRFRLDGDAAMCACPACRAPMSVRLWLRLADCWRCGATIELTDEDERAIRDLLAAAGIAESREDAFGEPPAFEWGRRHDPYDRPESNSPETASPKPVAGPARRAELGRTHAFWDELFRETPAWLISLITHLVLLTILALWTYSDEQPRAIVISATIRADRIEGGDNLLAPPQAETRFDLPLPSNVDLTSDRERKAIELAEEDARELRIDPSAPHPQLPPILDVKRRLGETGDIRAALAARDPRIRVDMVTREGGTSLTEAAVSRGLRWLAMQQEDDGSWRLTGHDGRGGVESRSAATGMALLAFLGAGQTHLTGRYQAHVARGVRWLIEHQNEDGDLRADSQAQAGMYAHGQASIALCEAYALTGDEQIREPARRAVQFIVDAQYADGGWRYTPREPSSPSGGDTSVVGWQLMALQSARAAGLEVPNATFELAGQFLDRVQARGGALYAYRPGDAPSPTMTAEGLLCRLYLGWRRDTGGLSEGVRYLVQDHLPVPGNWNIYYWYYGTQTLHHYGGEEWDQWNTRMRDLLVVTQEVKGHVAGSWPPRGAYADVGGRLYVTALAVCTLEVYYRHLPLFRPMKLDANTGDHE